jgi:three-Cys-motif partner protein
MTTTGIEWQDDGLPVIERGHWAEKKSRVVFNYMMMFSTGMKRKWRHRVYLDLYSGPGCVRLRSSSRIIMGSPLLALSVTDPFDRYVFCEQDIASFSALLKERTKNRFGHVDSRFIEGDCNSLIDRILEETSHGLRKEDILVFCFVDPSDIGLHMSTLKHLARAFPRIDFLVLLALFMDPNRNEQHYLNPSNRKVDNFLDDTAWREKWGGFKSRDLSFPRFLSQQFCSAMYSEGYIQAAEGNTLEFRSDERNLPLYHLAFFSRHQRGYDFWKKGKTYAINQGSLDFFE